MPIQISTVSEFQQYLDGVIRRAGHHARNVQYVVPALASAVVLYKDPNSEITVGGRSSMKNLAWAYFDGTKYTFSFDHVSRSSILMRQKKSVVGTFTNATSAKDILDLLEALSRKRNP